MGQLKLIRVSGGVSKVLWKISGNQGQQWKRHSISVQSATPYKVNIVIRKTV